MGRKAVDLSGKRFGRLVVLRRTKSDRKWKPAWVCKCDCGKEVVSYSDYLCNGHTKSCGCFSSEVAAQKNLKHHGSGTRLYGIWRSMIRRCEDPNDCNYARYGMKGIRVSSEWHEFERFRDWAMKNGYKDTLSIDRIENNGPYADWNCRWADLFTQANNRSNNRVIFYNGESRTLAEWCRVLGLKYKTVHRRLANGHSVKESFSGGRFNE